MATADTVREILSQNMSETFVELITFKAKNEPTGYLAINNEDVVSRNITFHAADIEFKPAKQTGTELTSATIMLSNINGDIINIIRSHHEKPTITTELISLARPDVVEETVGPFEVESVVYTTKTLKAKLGLHKDILEERFPYGSYTPTYFPGVFL